MNWTTIRATLKSVVESIDDLTAAGTVEWADSAQASALRPLPRIDLSTSSVIGYGDDEQRTDRTDTNSPVAYVSGPRRFTLSIRIESDRATGGEAQTVADRLRARLRRQGVTDACAEVGLGIADFAPIQILDMKRDGRALVVAVLDVFVNCAENDADETERATDYIADAQINSEYLTEPDGSQSPAQIDALVDT